MDNIAKIKAINKIYDDFMSQILILSKKQNEILIDFMKKLEAQKIEQIRKEINSQE